MWSLLLFYLFTRIFLKFNKSANVFCNKITVYIANVSSDRVFRRYLLLFLDFLWKKISAYNKNVSIA